MKRSSSASPKKYFKRGSRIRWPEGAISRESINTVKKLGHLKDMLCRSVDSFKVFEVHFDGPFVFTVDDILCATAEIMGKSAYWNNIHEDG
ncbi:hypothetical protein VNO80_30629 [Phaseolus coccineus]|uniref:Uncharacterized protein n=1 Tax=Phaseolus coccineus TaxID=3886 RepID=A0AAN9LD41_PHACN